MTAPDGNTSNDNQSPVARPLSAHEEWLQHSARRRAASRRFSDEWEQDPDTGRWFPVADRE